MITKEPIDLLKEFIGEMPLTAELYWYLRQAGHPPPGSFSLEPLKEYLTTLKKDAAFPTPSDTPWKKVFLFARFRSWISQTAITGLALAGLGHEVYLGFLPYTNRKEPEKKFDLRRQNLYIKKVLGLADPLLNLVSFWEEKISQKLPSSLVERLEVSTLQDVKYILMREDVSKESDLYQFRLQRNLTLARTVVAWLSDNTPDVIILPNGNNLEFGVLFHVGRYLNIPVVTYEFGEQQERMWLAQNQDVMRQETDQLWKAYRDQPLTDEEWDRIQKLYAARQGADLWKNFARQWQKTASQGGEKVRATLGLDHRPLVFVPTNVLGDSLTFGRQVFSAGMTEWLVRTIEYFKIRPEYQLVIRIHPGEQLGWGPSIYDILNDAFEAFPENIHLIPADSAINSYDLVEITTCAAVYTTTLGIEMAMKGLPVVVAGKTHYKNKGFTLDPNTWEEYFGYLEKVLASPDESKLSEEQIKQAWTYAYRFFFDYPFPFPWHVQHLWESVEKWPLHRVLSEEGQKKFGDTFRYLVGEPIERKK